MSNPSSTVGASLPTPVRVNPPIAQSRLPRPSTPSGLLQPTRVLERLPEIQAGRPDPFASVNGAPMVTRRVVVSPSPLPAAEPPQVQPPAPVVARYEPPVMAPLPLPAVQPVPLPPLGGELPGVPVPVGSPAQAARTIEVSGVVQIGDRTHAIVKVPEESSSRYVGVGEYLAGGSILLKRIDMQNGGEPRVIFVQNGEEIVRMVGGAATL